MNIIDLILFTFSDRELDIYRKRNFERKDFMELGKEFGVTRERMRQMCDKMDKKIQGLGLNVKINIIPE